MSEAKNQRPEKGERIAKAIARAGLASRREAELWIAAGRVAVNGTPIASPAVNVGERDRITVDGVPLPKRERTRLFLYHKPRGLLTTRADPQGRPTLFERLPADLPRLISIGRLDFNTEGLLLLTNDGALARTLELPATGWLRRYRVRAHVGTHGSAHGAVTQADLDRLRDGVTISGIHYGAIDAVLDRVQGSNLWLTFAIREGKNREVRNVLGHLGLDVTRLIRVSFGPFQLGELAEGAVEEVRTRTLREQLGARIITESGVDLSTPVTTRPAPQPAAKRDARAPKPGRKKPTSHSWRAPDDARPDKPLRRKFHGARHGKEASKENERAAMSGDVRAGLISDRKGRSVPVERHGDAPPREPVRKEVAKRGRQRPRRAFDRKGGARPRHPGGRK